MIVYTPYRDFSYLKVKYILEHEFFIITLLETNGEFAPENGFRWETVVCFLGLKGLFSGAANCKFQGVYRGKKTREKKVTVL